MALGILDQRLDANAREYVQDAREEVRHMSGLVNELLSFSKAGLRHRDLPMESVNLRPLVEKTLDRECPEAGPFTLEIPEELHVLASRDLLARAIGNLVRNALRYAGSAGTITLSAESNDGQVRLRISDLGPGVPEDSLARLGEPFYRPDAARTREDGGVGLGLAIVRSCIEACKGSVQFRNRKPAGFEAELTLKAGEPGESTSSVGDVS
jgi:two-component system sensor histidine kinase CpxA